MIVAEFLKMSVGKVKIINDETGKLLQVLDRRDQEVPEEILGSEINYCSPCLQYFTNSKRAEYSASINIYI